MKGTRSAVEGREKEAAAMDSEEEGRDLGEAVMDLVEVEMDSGEAAMVQLAPEVAAKVLSTVIDTP